MKIGIRRGSIILTFFTAKNSVGCTCQSLHSRVAVRTQLRSLGGIFHFYLNFDSS